MKKLLIMIFMSIIFMFNSVSYASPFIDKVFTAKFDSDPAIATIEDMVSAFPASPMPGVYFDQNDAKNPEYYTDGQFSVGTIEGIVLKFTNTSDSVVVLNWANSSISANGYSYGIPFLAGMKYKDAGNPAATPNTILPPGQSQLITAFIPSVKLKNSSWTIMGQPLRRSSNISFSFYVAVISNGNTQYLEINTPGIYIP